MTQAELDEVKSLHHQGIKPGRSTKPSGQTIKELAEQRKVRHDKALDAFVEERKSAYMEVEARVLKAGQDVKDEIEDLDNKVRGGLTQASRHSFML